MKNLLVPFVLFSFLASAQTPCEDGKAGNYDCFGVDLQSRIGVVELGAEDLNGNWLNDIWGWVDPETNREYALVGMTNGTSFVDVTDPVNPIVLGILLEHNSQTDENQTLHDGAKSIWRDIKVYKNHAYIVSEDAGHGLQVFDLTQLRDVVDAPVEFKESGHYDGIGNAHNLAINEETGFAFAVGFRGSCSAGGLHIIDLVDPKNPTFASCFSKDGYTHDTQCVIYNGPDSDYIGQEICFSANEEDLVIVDVTDKESISQISKTGYENAQYVHQGWLTEDHRYFISNDELDERNLNHNTRTFLWDMQDLDAPVLLGYCEHETASIDHNLYTLGKNVYQSNYTSGLRILDTTGISKGRLQEIAYFDTYVSGNEAAFRGSWSNYPYLPSGNIIVSDITNGLFVLKMQELFIVEQPADLVACVGQHINIPIIAEGKNIKYQWQIDEGNGFENIEDFERYHSTTKTSLHAHALRLNQDGNRYRCIISNDQMEIISEAMTLTVLDSPRAAFTYEKNMLGCAFTFNNSSEAADSFIWNFGNGDESDEESPSYKYTESGQYEVSLIATNGCTSDTLIQNIEVEIEKPTASYSVEAQTDGTVTFTNTSTGAESYLWVFGDGSQSTEESPTYKYEDSGIYEIQLIATNGCASDGLIQDLDLIILSANRDLSGTQIYPTVATDRLNIRFPNTSSFEVLIHSLQGQKVLQQSFSDQSVTIPVSSLEKGIYILDIITEESDQRISRKIVIE